ncbi:MAG: thioredoxin [Acidobacteria bacterium]|nr:thioredoxin [Acidobacteriota bacterium]
MATTSITAETFDNVVTAGGTVVLDFWAAWCGPCRTFAPIFEKVSDSFPDVTFGKIDTEDQQDLARAFNIMSIPTLMIIRDQIVIFHQAGVVPEAALTDLVTQALALDMDAVRDDIANDESDEQ